MPATALQLARQSSGRAHRRGWLRYAKWTPAQWEFICCTEPEVLWRDGNQLGKSFALAGFALLVCLGEHPTIPWRGPVKILVVSVSREQMVPLMEKLWELVPHEELLYGDYDAGRGLVGKPPRLVFRNGSEILFATYKQGATRIAGGTYDMVLMDEPPPESLYGEVRPRVMRRRGLIRVTMTPTPDMPPQDWYRQRVQEGRVHELNWGLSEAMLWPEGYPAPWLRQAEIDAYAAGLLTVERRMRVEGSWEALVTGAWLEDFDDGRHVKLIDPRRLRGWHLTVGCDHGTVGGKQAAVLIATKARTTDRPQIRVLAETVSEGVTTPEHDAEAILDMLAEYRLDYDDVDLWVGDVATGSKRYEVRKSNKDLRGELARQIGRPVRKTKRIVEPHKFSGSLTYGMRLLNTLYKRDAMLVSKRCPSFADACAKFAGDSHDPVKDVLDAGRYAVERALQGSVLPILSARY